MKNKAKAKAKGGGRRLNEKVLQNFLKQRASKNGFMSQTRRLAKKGRRTAEAQGSARTPCGYDVVQDASGSVVAQLVSDGTGFDFGGKLAGGGAKVCLKASGKIPVDECKYCKDYAVIASQ